MKNLCIMLFAFFVSATLFSQERVLYEDIVSENKKYAILHYYFKTYDDEAYISDFVNKILPLDEATRNDLMPAYKSYQGDDVIYSFSGIYMDLYRSEAGECSVEIRLTDTITENEELDVLITDLTSSRDKFNSYKDLTESGEDQSGQYKIRKRWELGKGDFFLKMFQRMYWDASAVLIYIQHTPLRWQPFS